MKPVSRTSEHCAPSSPLSMGSLALLLYFPPVLLSRLLYLWYASLAADIVWRDSPLCSVVRVLAFFMEMIPLAAALALIPAAVKFLSRKSALALWLLFVLSQASNALTAFLIDLWNGRLEEDGRIEMALMSLGLSLLLSALIALISFLLSLPLARRHLPLSVVLSCLVCLLTRLGIVVYDIVAFLREVHYPTEQEVSSMLSDLVYTVLQSGLGIGVLAFSVLSLILFLRKGKQEK